MSMMSKEKITLDDLANMVAKGFEANAEEFASIRGELVEMKSQIVVLDTKVNRIDLKVEVLDTKVNRIDLKVEDIREIISTLEEGEILDLQKRVQILEKNSRGLAKHSA